jgi:hypothetical protein
MGCKKTGCSEEALKETVDKHLPLQIRNNSRICNGWVDLTIEKAGEKLVLHATVISIEPYKNVEAGY